MGGGDGSASLDGGNGGDGGDSLDGREKASRLSHLSHLSHLPYPPYLPYLPYPLAGIIFNTRTMGKGGVGGGDGSASLDGGDDT